MSEIREGLFDRFLPLFRKLCSSYLEKTGDDVTWLSNLFSRELSESGSDIALEMLDTAERFQRRKEELDHAVQSGASKEQWLADFLRERSLGMPVQEYGRGLSELVEILSSANERYFRNFGSPSKESFEDPEKIHAKKSFGEQTEREYNHYETERIARSVGKHAALFSLWIHSEEVGVPREECRSELPSEDAKILDERARQVVALGGFRVAVCRGEVAGIDEKTSPSLLAIIACAALERCRTVETIVSGKVSMTKGADRLARIFPVMVAATICSTFTFDTVENVRVISDTASVWAPVTGGMIVFLLSSDGFLVGEEILKAGEKLASFVKQVAKAATSVLQAKQHKVGESVRRRNVVENVEK